MKVLSIVACVAVVIGIGWFLQVRSAAADAAYRAYEECVQAEYGMLPSTYYSIHGVTPTCS